MAACHSDRCHTYTDPAVAWCCALPYAPPADFASALDRAFRTLDHVALAGKELIIAGLVRAISEDGTVRVAEAELLRVIAAALHCPLPPLIADANVTSA